MSDIRTGNAFENLKNCFWGIIQIIQQTESSRRDWDSTADEIVDDFMRNLNS